jgi:HEPN domain-containing protein
MNTSGISIIRRADFTICYPDTAYGMPYELYGETIAGEILEKSREVVRWIGSQIETSGSG